MEQLRTFLSGTLSAAGGVIEDTGDGFDVLLPVPAAASLGLPEAAHITLGTPEMMASPFSHIDGRFGSALVDRLVDARLAAPPLAIVALPLELPRPLPHGIPVLLNAVAGSVDPHTLVPTRYLQAHLRLRLEADERRSVLVTSCIRLSDGARVSPLRLSGAYPFGAPPLTDEERHVAGQALRWLILQEGAAAMRSALDGVQRRANRDLERLHEYFASLDAEMAQAAARARTAEERARREHKRAALPEDLAARRAQLSRRFSPRLSGQLIAAILIHTDVQLHAVRVRRRSRDGVVNAYRRAGDGALEGPGCAVCRRETLRLYLCDEQLHVLCDRCGQSGRLDPSRCRACRQR